MRHVVLLGQRCLGLRHVDHRHQPAEQQEQSEEQAKRSDQHRPVHPGWAEVRPSTW